MFRVLLVLSLLLPAAAHAQTVSYFTVIGRVGAVTAAADGNLWFIHERGVGRMTPLGEVTIIPTSTMLSSTIVSGPNDTVWFTRFRGIDSFDIRTGAHSSYDVPYLVQGLLAAPDGNVWFTVDQIGLGRLAPDGEITMFPVEPSIAGMALGPDGNIWFTQYGFGAIGRVTPRGDITFFTTSPRGCCGQAIASAADGTLWTTLEGPKLARLSVQGTILKLFDLPSYAWKMGVGHDGRVWFNTPTGFDVLASDGQITSIAVPGMPENMSGLVAAGDGNMWATTAKSFSCSLMCSLPLDVPAVGFLRVNLVNPAPAITSVVRAYAGVMIRGLGFVPDTVIRFNGTDQTTTYVSPFEIVLNSQEASSGGTFTAVNKSPGGGTSAPFVFIPEPVVRRRAIR
ncbi:MAG: hypothetical protein AABO58_07130 [Acidobacteriota bacterium]